MQSIYALLQSKSDDLKSNEKFLHYSLSKSYDLYVLLLLLLVEVRNLADQHIEIGKKKYLATDEDKNPNRKFIKNSILKKLKDSSSLQNYASEKKLGHWKEHTEYVRIIWDEINKSELYKNYISSIDFSFEDDKVFIIEVFKTIVAPNEKLFEFFESEQLSWIDDLPLVNTYLVKRLGKLSPHKDLKLQALYKDEDDKEFVSKLYEKVALHHHEFTEDIDKKTPNWDTDRIAEIDMILMKMALTEFVYFPSIPVRVTINEYLEIAKDYSTEKSSFFINGVLDKISKEYTNSDKIKKVGRGLL